MSNVRFFTGCIVIACVLAGRLASAQQDAPPPTTPPPTTPATPAPTTPATPSPGTDGRALASTTPVPGPPPRTDDRILAPAAGDRALMDDLLRRIEDLEREIRALRQASSSPPSAPAALGLLDAARNSDNSAADAPPPGPPPSGAPTGPSPQTGQGPGEHDMGLPTGARLTIRGFNDVDLRTIKGDDRPKSFALGQLDLFFSSRLSDQFSFLGEMVIEPDETNAFGVDFERMQVQWKPNDYFSVSGGRYHTAIGFYNTQYHHGTWFQSAIGRPFIFQFEDSGGILPVHSVGVSASGRLPSGRAGLRWVAEIGNGRRSRSPQDEPVQNRLADKEHKSINVALIARPDAVAGLQAGFSVYHDVLVPGVGTATPLPRVDETILAGHVVYQNPVFEQFNEALVMKHSVEGGSGTFTLTSFYSQIAKQFARYRPYFRYEYLNVPDADPIWGATQGFLDTVATRYGPSVGLRVDVADLAALKLQYDHLTRRNKTTIDGLTFQLAFTF